MSKSDQIIKYEPLSEEEYTAPGDETVNVKIEHLEECKSEVYEFEDTEGIFDFVEDVKPVVKEEISIGPTVLLGNGHVVQCETNDLTIDELRSDIKLLHENNILLDESPKSIIETFACHYCSKTFKAKSKLRKHIVQYICQKQLLQISSQHRVINILQCDVCAYKTKRQKYYKNHIQTHNFNIQYSCHICSFETLTRSLFEKHAQRHEDTKYYTCHLCSYKTPKSKLLQIHLTNHTKPSKLQKNQSSVSDENCITKPHKCHLCEYASSQKGHLNRHVKEKHLKLFKKKKCEICAFETLRSCVLRRHLLRHTGIAPYKCKLCSFRTAQKNNLKRHERTHTGEKPYKCSKCSYISSQSCDLKKHFLAKHTDIRPYECHYCNFKAAQSSVLTSHVNSKHAKHKKKNKMSEKNEADEAKNNKCA